MVETFIENITYWDNISFGRFRSGTADIIPEKIKVPETGQIQPRK